MLRNMKKAVTGTPQVTEWLISYKFHLEFHSCCLAPFLLPLSPKQVFPVYDLPTQEGCHIPRLWAKGISPPPLSFLFTQSPLQQRGRVAVLYIYLPTEIRSAILLSSQSPSEALKIKINRTLSGCSDGDITCSVQKLKVRGCKPYRYTRL